MQGRPELPAEPDVRIGRREEPDGIAEADVETLAREDKREERV